jgi:hypothetical protein
MGNYTESADKGSSQIRLLFTHASSVPRTRGSQPQTLHQQRHGNKSPLFKQAKATACIAPNRATPPPLLSSFEVRGDQPNLVDAGVPHDIDRTRNVRKPDRVVSLDECDLFRTLLEDI